MKQIVLLAIVMVSCQDNNVDSKEKPVAVNKESKTEVITLAGGCFWCTEAVFKKVRGVINVDSGYIGGTVKNPSYKEVCTGETGHAEAVKITFNPKEITLVEILEVFFATHDPTSLNKQGADEGTQYRSEIFYYSDIQKQIAEELIAKLTAKKAFSKKIVTKVSPATPFYIAESHHQDYYENNSYQGYCQLVIAPKLLKLSEKFSSKLK